MFIMAGTNHLAMGVAHYMVLHSFQALHAECQMGGVRTVGSRVPQSFFLQTQRRTYLLQSPS